MSASHALKDTYKNIISQHNGPITSILNVLQLDFGT